MLGEFMLVSLYAILALAFATASIQTNVTSVSFLPPFALILLIGAGCLFFSLNVSMPNRMVDLLHWRQTPFQMNVSLMWLSLVIMVIIVFVTPFSTDAMNVVALVGGLWLTFSGMIHVYAHRVHLNTSSTNLAMGVFLMLSGVTLLSLTSFSML